MSPLFYPDVIVATNTGVVIAPLTMLIVTAIGVYVDVARFNRLRKRCYILVLLQITSLSLALTLLLAPQVTSRERLSLTLGTIFFAFLPPALWFNSYASIGSLFRSNDALLRHKGPNEFANYRKIIHLAAIAILWVIVLSTGISIGLLYLYAAGGS